MYSHKILRVGKDAFKLFFDVYYDWKEKVISEQISFYSL